MHKLCHLTVVLMIAVAVADLSADAESPEPGALTNGRKAYEQECARAVAPITVRYVRWLENTKREYGAKGDVAAALLFENEINRVAPTVKQPAAGLGIAKSNNDDKQEDQVAAIAALPPEDQQIVKALKFSDFEAVRFGLGHVYCNIKVVNKSSQQSITDKLTAETRMLCKNKDGEWSVCQGSAKLNITEKGTQVVQLGGLGNASQMRDHNGGQPEPYDAHIVVRYMDTVVYKATWKNRKGAPEKWMDNDTLIYKR